jgi:hypothetical protein
MFIRGRDGGVEPEATTGQAGQQKVKDDWLDAAVWLKRVGQRVWPQR